MNVRGIRSTYIEICTKKICVCHSRARLHEYPTLPVT